MKRRNFLISISAAITSLVSPLGRSAITMHSHSVLTVSCNGKHCKIHNEFYRLPRNPVPFKDVIEVEVKGSLSSVLPKICGNGQRIMSKRKKLELREESKFILQYTGPDMGWIVLG